MSSGDLADLATTAISGDTQSLYREHVNPQWARLLDVLRMNVRYTRCRGTVLHTEDGREVLDFFSGYCVHNTGHNHPHIVRALEDELRHEGPAMVQSHVPDLAGQLAAELCARAALFGQMVVMNLFKRGILTQMCGNNFMVLKAAPPLVVEEVEINRFVTALAEVVELIHSSGSFWSDALGMARRAVNI